MDEEKQEQHIPDTGKAYGPEPAGATATEGMPAYGPATRDVAPAPARADGPARADLAAGAAPEADPHSVPVAPASIQPTESLPSFGPGTQGEAAPWQATTPLPVQPAVLPAGHSGEAAPGAPDATQAGAARTAVQPGLEQPGVAQIGTTQPGLEQPGVAQTGTAQPGTSAPALGYGPGSYTAAPYASLAASGAAGAGSAAQNQGGYGSGSAGYGGYGAAGAGYGGTATYQPWETPAKPQRTWSTRVLALVSALSMIFGGVVVGSIGAAVSGFGANSTRDNSQSVPRNYSENEGLGGNGWDAIPDYGQNSWGEDGTDPFFPEGTRQTAPSAEVDSAPGVLLINSMLTNGIGAGTGIVISEDGYAVTNYHVVEGSTTVRVQVADTDEVYTAAVLGHNAETDVALLKLEDASGLAALEFDTSKPTKGTGVYALGNASGQGYASRVDGEITAINQNITARSETNIEELVGLIQTDADIVQGYSGGPLLNEDGKVVGMTVAASSAARSGDTDGFAIPAAEVLQIVEQIKSGKSDGATKVGRNAALGITVASAEYVQGATVRGAVVQQVNAGSAAEKAGIQVFDTITEVNGTRITSASDLSKLIKTFTIGDEVTVELVTQTGEEKSLTIDLGESPVN